MPYCPKCRAEYRDGFYKCSDCDVPLVSNLPEERPVEYEYIEYKELMRTLSPTDIAFIKSVLESHNIKYYVKGDHFLAVRPLVESAIIMVAEEQHEEARELMQDFKGRFTGLAPRD